MPNILKVYRPDLIGYSAELSNPAEESLNVGISGARTDLTTFQVNLLIGRLRADPQIDFYNDWKVVTVFIGYNDVCDYSCTNNSLELLNQWIDNIDQALMFMRDNIPLTFVNLMLITRLSVGVEYIAANPQCALIANSICPCILSGPVGIARSDVTVDLFNRRLSELVDSRKYDIANDFTVVVQPFLSNTAPFRDENGIIDTSFAAADCLHLSLTGNRIYAAGLWKNMLQPVGSKDTLLTSDVPPVCPADDFPYLYTYLNSASE